jgi:hypothetical protein
MMGLANQASTQSKTTMKTMKFAIIGLLALAGGLHAKQGEKKGGNGELFTKLDADADGVLSKDEWLKGPAQNIGSDEKANGCFNRADANNDGVLDAGEWNRGGGNGKHKGHQKGKGGQNKGIPGKAKGGRGKGGAGKGAAGI